jgi:hypothetical protein
LRDKNELCILLFLSDIETQFIGRPNHILVTIVTELFRCPVIDAHEYKYTHTHTHTHTYIYIYIYTYGFLFRLEWEMCMFWVDRRATSRCCGRLD